MSAVLKPVEYRELLLGSGGRQHKAIVMDGMAKEFSRLTTLDVLPEHNPDVVHDLTVMPMPFDTDTFDEIHAYEVLEHCGRQGDWRLFFRQFEEFWRILKPDGWFCASVPLWDSEWAWADPGHTRVIAPKTLMFLERPFYDLVGKDARSDYRPVYRGDFRVRAMQEKDQQFFFAMQAIK
jgi:SAM-dependent methyltransferase